VALVAVSEKRSRIWLSLLFFLRTISLGTHASGVLN
jgi:hypothetical protein